MCNHNNKDMEQVLPERIKCFCTSQCTDHEPALTCVILPPLTIGSSRHPSPSSYRPRYGRRSKHLMTSVTMMPRSQDAMADSFSIVIQHIQLISELSPGQDAFHRPDLIDRIFKMGLDDLLHERASRTRTYCSQWPMSTSLKTLRPLARHTWRPSSVDTLLSDPPGISKGEGPAETTREETKGRRRVKGRSSPSKSSKSYC
ncbi:MAG: hypothetical protein J3Q66DRAFT_349350 [Benniella sp.]|nr:MAG: hypothetical protein J3Q66DRAFT_349350 [Benniella sp.]